MLSTRNRRTLSTERTIFVVHRFTSVVMKCRCIGVIRHSSVTATSMNTGKFICLFYFLEFISLNFRVEIDFNDNFESYRDCSRLKFYEIIKLTFRCRS